MGLQLIQHQLHAGFELAIMPSRHILGQILDSHIRCDAVIFHLPVAVEAINRVAGRCYRAAIEQLRKTADAHQSAHVRVPTSFPMPAFLKYHGIASPPEPAFWLMSITLGRRWRPPGRESAWVPLDGSGKRKRGGRIRAIRSAAVRRLAPKDTARTWTESNISTDLEDQLQGQLQGARPPV